MRRFHPQFLDQNRRDIGTSQSIWTDSNMVTARSHRHDLGVEHELQALGVALFDGAQVGRLDERRAEDAP
jgi:hypothetical protein